MYSVLMVDDEEIALAAMKKGVCWEKLGISEVYTATNIIDARHVLDEHEIDVLICDIEMPNGSGIELVQWMTEYGKDTICIFLTCHSEFNYAKKAISLGVMEYMLKPVDYDELTEVIQKAIWRKKENVEGERARALLSDVSKHSAPVVDEEQKNQHTIENAQKYIRDNISREFGRDDVAAYVFLNPDYLSRLFKKNTGYSISEYIFKVRMSVACELLTKTDLSVSKVAMSCGYTHLAHFSKMFKKETGMTPNSYRGKYKQ